VGTTLQVGRGPFFPFGNPVYRTNIAVRKQMPPPKFSSLRIGVSKGSTVGIERQEVVDVLFPELIKPRDSLAAICQGRFDGGLQIYPLLKPPVYPLKLALNIVPFPQ
jgi:hypothetical protein